MKDILHNTLKTLDGFLTKIDRNPETGFYELEVGLPKNWIYKSTDRIEYEVIHEAKSGSLLRLFGTSEEVYVDELVDFVGKVISTNRKIVEMEEEFNRKLEEQKELLEKQVMSFQDQLEEVRESSFDDSDEDESEEKIINDNSTLTEDDVKIPTT